MKRTNIYLAEGQAAALDRVAQAAGVSRAELIRALIDRAIGGHPGADLAADIAAIDGSFGVIAEQEAFSRSRDERTDYLDRLADARDPGRQRRPHRAPARHHGRPGLPMFPGPARPF